MILLLHLNSISPSYYSGVRFSDCFDIPALNTRLLHKRYKPSELFQSIIQQQISRQMLGKNSKDILGDYDFSRSDKLFILKEGVPYYQFNLRDLIHNETYISQFRYNELKNIHEMLAKLNFQLPPFPVTHFWVKTNSNPELIEKRRAGLEGYFSRIVNDPYLRGYRQVKRIITMCKKNCSMRRRMSGDKKTENSSTTKRSLSESKSKKGEAISKQEWKRIKRGGTMNQEYIYFK